MAAIISALNTRPLRALWRPYFLRSTARITGDKADFLKVAQVGIKFHKARVIPWRIVRRAWVLPPSTVTSMSIPSGLSKQRAARQSSAPSHAPSPATSLFIVSAFRVEKTEQPKSFAACRHNRLSAIDLILYLRPVGGWALRRVGMLRPA
jgi:hypothetical protein